MVFYAHSTITVIYQGQRERANKTEKGIKTTTGRVGKAPAVGGVGEGRGRGRGGGGRKFLDILNVILARVTNIIKITQTKSHQANHSQNLQQKVNLISHICVFQYAYDLDLVSE